MAEPRQLRPLIRQQFPGRAPGADYVTEGCPKHVSNFDTSGGGGSLLYCGPCLASILD